MAGREFGVARKQLSGEAAAPYLGIARTQLGILKEAMSFQGLQQLQRTVELSDGTRIFVSSVFGQDTMRVDTPGVSEEEAVAAEAFGRGRRLYVAGERYDSATAQYVICRWEIDIIAGTARAKALDIFGMGLGGYGYQQLSMSMDGSVIVWAQADTNPGGTPTGGRIYKWSAANGVVLLAQDPVLALAFLVSTDGGTVAWLQFNTNIGYYDVLKHTDKEGTVRIGGTGVDTGLVSGGGAKGFAMSADGGAVAWNYGYDTGDIATSIYAVYRWSAQAGTVQIATPYNVFSGSYLGISADGSTVVWAENSYMDGVQIARWSAATGAQLLGGTNNSTGSTYIAADGTAIYWTQTAALLRWTTTAGLVTQPLLPFSPIPADTASSMALLRVSDDGSVASWTQNNTPSNSVSLCRWELGAAPVLLADVEALHYSYFYMSSDGGVITWVPSSDPNSLYRWTPAGAVMIYKGNGTPWNGGVAPYNTNMISPDGSAVAWQLLTPADEHIIYRWGGGIAALPAIDAAIPLSSYWGFTPDSYVLGYSYSTAKGDYIPALWMPDTYLSWDGYKIETATAAIYV